MTVKRWPYPKIDWTDHINGKENNWSIRTAKTTRFRPRNDFDYGLWMHSV